MSEENPWLSPAARREFEEFPLHKAMGLVVEDMRSGFARICMHTSSFTLGGVGGSVHGGLLAALVDIVMLRAMVATVGRDQQFAGTADLNITFLRPALGARVYAEANVLRKGKHIAVTEVSITDEQGRLCARGRTLYALRPVAP